MPPASEVATSVPIDACATAMAIVDAEFVVRAANPVLCEWLGSGSRTWRGDPLAMLDAGLAAGAMEAHRVPDGLVVDHGHVIRPELRHSLCHK